MGPAAKGAAWFPFVEEANPEVQDFSPPRSLMLARGSHALMMSAFKSLARTLICLQFNEHQSRGEVSQSLGD